MSKIIVTGGCGYIGSHTLVDLINNGFEVISIDNLSRAYEQTLQGVQQITGKSIRNYPIDLCDRAATIKVFEENPGILGIIHFAAYKSVPESMAVPLEYYRNNINSLINILHCVKEFKVPHFVFSSSCAVYGNADELPVTELTPFNPAESPYGRTKQIGEDICVDFSRANPNINFVLLRYFNPVGAHESAEIGDLNKRSENLVPIITETAIGLRDSMVVCGVDYATRDGSCIRDYIHVSDIAHAHTLAIKESIAGRIDSNCAVFNLGSGNGVTVLELIAAFERATGQKMNYTIGDRRPGDVAAIYANSEKANKQLGWTPQFSIESMMKTAWNWRLKISEKLD